MDERAVILHQGPRSRDGDQEARAVLLKTTTMLGVVLSTAKEEEEEEVVAVAEMRGVARHGCSR